MSNFYSKINRFKESIDKLGLELSELEPECLVLVPTHRSEDVVRHVVSTIEQGFRQYFPNMKVLCLLTGEIDNEADFISNFDSVKKFESKNFRIIGMVKESFYQGKSWSLYAGMYLLKVISKGKNTIFMNIDSDIKNITPEWVNSFITPVCGNYSLVYSSYISRQYKEDDRSLNDHFVAPLSTILSGHKVREVEGEFAMRLNPVVDRLLADNEIWKLQHPHLTFVPTAASVGAKFTPAVFSYKNHHWNEFPFSRFPEYVRSLFLELEKKQSLLYSVTSRKPKEIIKYSTKKYKGFPYINSNFSDSYFIFKKNFETYKHVYKKLEENKYVSSRLIKNLEHMSNSKVRFVSGLTSLEWAEIVLGFFKLFLISNEQERFVLYQSLTPCLIARVVRFESRHFSSGLKSIRQSLDRQDNVFYKQWSLNNPRTLKQNKRNKYVLFNSFYNYTYRFMNVFF